jgi:NAD(P)-dependent dehydrogenase (short-subunit alcohol dehydrogenase family)
MTVDQQEAATAATSPRASVVLPEAVAVSGSASGLGRVTAGALLEVGVRVVGIDLGEAPGFDAGDYTHVRGSVSEEATWDEAREALIASAPRTVGLVTCAAVLHVGTLLELPLEHWRQTLDVNVLGTVLAMRTFLPVMVERGGGSIVAVASVDAAMAEQQLPSYCASKGAVLQLARTAALDHARQGVRVNVVSPGPMRAGLFERHLQSAADPDRFLATRADRQPLGEILDPRQVADPIVFLLSEQAAGMTGANVLVDGGLTVGFDFRTGAEGASVN